MNTQSEKSLEQLLTALEKILTETKLTKTDITEETYEFTRILGSKDLLNTFDITKLLLEEIMDTGEIKTYLKKELVRILPWENTQTRLKLQNLVEEEILINEKRKYQLNVGHPFVKRVKQVIRISMEERDFEKDLEDFLQETTRTTQPLPNEETVTNEAEIINKPIQHRQASSKELNTFINNLRTTYFESLVNSSEEEIIEDLAKQIEKNILMTIGMIERK
ncbi:MAG: hypothetical protein ACTSSK_00305 [Candidatus Heimdallarchaeota archaeon]